MANKPLIMDHPLIQHKLTLLRDKRTGSKEFREMIAEVSMLMCYEATRDLPLKEVEIETPMTMTKSNVISGRKLAFVPILRAGLGMVDGVLEMIPAAKVGHIGIYRDPESHKPVDYYCKLPKDIASRHVIVLDPMLATGGSAVEAINLLKKEGVQNIKFMCIIAAPEGIQYVQDHIDPSIAFKVVVCAVDEKLNEKAYIVPGLGDAGDRLYGVID